MKIGIFGTGAYGMALCSILSDNNNEVTMWTKFEAEKNILIEKQGNPDLLEGYTLPNNVVITTSIEECVKDSDLLIIAIPAPFVTDLCIELSKYTNKLTNICIASKGIERKTGYFISDIVQKYTDIENISVISGPSFAIDIVTRKPIGLTVAATNDNLGKLVVSCFENDYVKLRRTNDIIGVEICGAIKNVIAISSGMLETLGASDSTRALLITEALYDIEKVIEVFGGDDKTILSYAGFGDLLLTCTSKKSRNYSFGMLLGKTSDRHIIEKYLHENTVEGYFTVESVFQLLKDKKVDIPIISLIYEIVNGREKADKLLSFLVEKI